ncbi:hypothetical protein [Caulobacter vibrioides]|uniref:Uncharacterized protein n=1 Tax=Caulobacter vibrioides (strain NA1000 / CB15N) TaxID=565050 RepID=A0A0H3C4B9_CAUVN|nr:hypothetical protein [Caulobacter vibrioides]YP_002515722.1 hypothetical protein CCNA_00347 [Caulobacter vibrioides NA1000]ACL93814.1 hypothetical protein CCNA_00347 [Caulobacter vibrioides NA1000]QBQ56885.1 hypothetical protein EUX21_00405 [synthetic Caulobacter sp. 'ethensis']QXZ52435.1 hypothetical protein KZH45_01765 [Caulobacter vibrioides]
MDPWGAVARPQKKLITLDVHASWRPPSPFDKLRVRTTVGLGSHKILILSLSKDEDFQSA